MYNIVWNKAGTGMIYLSRFYFFKQPKKIKKIKSMILNEKKPWEQWEFLTEHGKKEKDGVKNKTKKL